MRDSTLAALTRTCKKIHHEIDDQEQSTRRFRIQVSRVWKVGSRDSYYGPRMPFDMSLLMPLRSIYLEVYLDEHSSGERMEPIRMLEDILTALSALQSLKTFTFVYSCNVFGQDFMRSLDAKMMKIKVAVMRERRKTGMSIKDSEFEYAWQAVSAFKRML